MAPIESHEDIRRRALRAMRVGDPRQIDPRLGGPAPDPVIAGIVRRRVPALLATLCVASIASASWIWLHPPDPIADLRAHAGRLVSLRRTPAAALGARVERWRMVASNGDTAVGLWRAARARPEQAAAASPGRAPASARAWAVVILGGIGTDDRALLLVPDSLPVNVLAVAWPWNGARRMGWLEFIARVPIMRRALLRTPGTIALGVEAVRRECPACRVALLGASLGAPPTAVALSLERADAIVLVDGGADLDRLLRAEVSHATRGGIVGAIVGAAAGVLGARLLSSLEPARHLASARELPALLVDAEREERVPQACVERLRETFPQADRATHVGGHVRAENAQQIASLVEIVWGWLAALRDRENGS